MPQACPVRQPGLKPAGIESKEPAEIKGGDRCKVAWKHPLRSRARSLFHCSGKVKQRRLAMPKVGSRQVRRSTRHKVRKSRIVEALACSSGEQKPIPRVERISVRATPSGKRTRGRGEVIFPAAMVVPRIPQKKCLTFKIRSCQNPSMETFASSFKLRADASEGRKPFPPQQKK
jgi:hypothetical protein